MKLTEELMQALGFVDMGNHWIDSYHVILYKDQVPATLLELKNLLTGTAFNKGKRASTKPTVLDMETVARAADQQTMYWKQAMSRYTEAQGNG